MKTFSSIICLILIITPISAETDLGFGQVWHKADTTPLFENKGDSGSWNGGEESWIWNWGHVLQDGDTLKYYMGASDGTNYSIGMWYSTRIDSGWQEYAGNPVLTGTAGAWDSSKVGMPFVLKDGDMYKMWYVGGAYDGTHGGSNSVGYATSSDGVNWEKYPEPVLNPDPADPDWQWINFPYVLDEGDTLKMWYTHSKINPTDEQIYHAYSLDGITWVKYREGPVFHRTNPGFWLASPSVRPMEGGGYVLWATEGAYGGDFNAKTIVAQSDDGINWRRDHLYNPVLKLGVPGSWEDDVASMTDVVTLDGIHYGLYSAWNETDPTHFIGLAKYEPTVVPAGNVSGTWTKAGSPYRVEGAITVPRAQTLTIEPGVTVQFLYASPLKVDGRILAEGAAGDRIRFRPVDTLGYYDEGKGKGVWGGIRFHDTAPTNERSLLKYCDIEFGEVLGDRYLTGVAGAAVGGGLLVDNFSKLTVDNCLFQYNRAIARISTSYGVGGGIAIVNGASPEIINSVIQYNRSQNLGNYHDDNGGGIWIYKNASPLISGNIIRGNRSGDTGGGVAIWEDSNPVLVNNLIVENHAERKGGIEGYGGGVSIGWDARPIFINNTIRKNSAYSVGGGVYLKDAAPVFINTIIAGNKRLNALSGEEWGNEMGAVGNLNHTIKFYSSCLENGVKNIQFGITNLADKGAVTFRNSTSAQPSLSAYYKPSIVSPALGTGTDKQWVDGVLYTAPDFDIDGNPRCQPAGSTPDMGCYESELCAPMMRTTEKWWDYPENPVLEHGPSGAWDSRQRWGHDVLYFDGRYHMWFSGHAGGAGPWSIGYATSKEGLSWEIYAGNPVLKGNNLKWYGTQLFAPDVVKVDSVFHMYFWSNTSSVVGHATSLDGINWSISEHPALELGSATSWEGSSIIVADVMHDTSGFKMWYSGTDGNDNVAVGYATSRDGINWSKHANNPIFERGVTGAWDSGKPFYGASVVYNGRYYYLWYQGKDGVNGSQIGRAYSSDGINWNRTTVSAPEVTIGSAGSWNDKSSWLPTVVLEGGKYRMWHAGAYHGDNDYWTIGYTEWAETEPNWVDIEQEIVQLPTDIRLAQNYPNPFNPTTQIRYSLPEISDVTLVVYDMLGREITELVNTQQGLGAYEVQWNGLNRHGDKVPTGVYFARLTAGKQSEVIKMLLLK